MHCLSLSVSQLVRKSERGGFWVRVLLEEELNLLRKRGGINRGFERIFAGDGGSKIENGFTSVVGGSLDGLNIESNRRGFELD